MSDIVFVDTSYYIALVNPGDHHHVAATRFTLSFTGRIVTTSLVLAELGSFFAVRPARTIFIQLDGMIRNDPQVELVMVNEDLLGEAVRLFGDRMDKDWSLVDCASFIVMKQRSIRSGLTTDHHFKQAGFEVPLLDDVGE